MLLELIVQMHQETRPELLKHQHMDIMGFICCSLFGFGWARPVQINSDNFRNIKKGIGWTSVAGVLMNLILGFVGCGLYNLTLLITAENYFILFLQQFFYFLFQFIHLMDLNLLRILQNMTMAMLDL